MLPVQSLEKDEKEATNLKALMTSRTGLPVSPCQPAWTPSPLLTHLPDVPAGKPREGPWAYAQLLLDPASGFLLIVQIRNRCAKAEHLLFTPQCVFLN